jgi:hypothetical protein
LHRFSRSEVTALAVVAVAVAVGGAAFAYGREWGSADSVASAGRPNVPAPETLPGPTDLPRPGATPDTSRPGWGLPYRNEDAAKPRFDQEFNGIKVGPTVKVASSGICKAGEAQYTTPAVGAASPLAMNIQSLPRNANLDRETVVQCKGTVVAVEREYAITPDADAESRIRSGAANWFDIEHGGSIYVFKGAKEFPAQDSQIAAERWSAGIVGGRPAAIARLILDGGFGNSMVVVWDDIEKIEVVVTGIEVRLETIVRIAEEVSR